MLENFRGVNLKSIEQSHFKITKVTFATLTGGVAQLVGAYDVVPRVRRIKRSN